jgi:coenzyme F420-0:L-glutamate ligase/coenzyme F420-1:gamma-L-glutamate ligase
VLCSLQHATCNMQQLTLTPLPGIPLIQPNDDIAQLVIEALNRSEITLQDHDILVIAHKIISKSEGRLVRLSDVVPTEAAHDLAAVTGKDPRFIQVVLDDAVGVERSRRGVIITEQRGGWIVANSAIDQSNVPKDGEEQQLLLLPLDPDASARRLRDTLKERTGATVAVIINDTHGRPFRMGAVGVAIGVAGMQPLADLRGEHDLFGYTLQSTEIATADEIAAAASILQGQTAQGTPVVHLRGLRLSVYEEGSARQLQRPRTLDLFR